MALRKLLFYVATVVASANAVIPAIVVGQSKSPDEEHLRSALLTALKKTTEISQDQLRPFYQRPNRIPIRSQEDTNTQATIALGEKLFFDKRLSALGDTSCATCHDPSKHWVDGRAQSLEGTSRRSMSLYNIAWDSCFTWHCEAGSIMSQGVLALTAPRGMGADPIVIAKRISSLPEYRQLFADAFPHDKEIASPGFLLSALEYFVSTIVSSQSSFDRWVSGDESAISPEAKRGFILFHTRAPCAQCHNLWRFSDSRTYDIGLPESTVVEAPLYKAVGLRGIAKRPPYMHDGSLATLEDVILFYMRGGDVTRPTKSAHIRPFKLSTSEKDDLISFLRTL